MDTLSRPCFLFAMAAPKRGRGQIADAFAARAADELIMLREIPKAQRPVADPERIGHQRPIFILDLSPQFRRQARGGNGTGVPGVRSGGSGLIQRLRLSLRELGGARLNGLLAIVGEQALHGFDQRRHGGFRVGGDGKIDILVALEVLIIALVEQVGRADADQLCSGLDEGSRNHFHLAAQRVHDAEEIVDFQSQDHVGIGDRGARALV